MSKKKKGQGNKQKPPPPAPYQRELSPRGFFLWHVKLIQPNKRQPRKYFAEEAMTGLQSSIARLGILNPITIKVLNENTGEALLVDGERRFRCATQLDMEKVPVFLSEADRSDILRESVVQNFCREEMTEIETARALQSLMDKYGYNQTEIAALVGKSVSWVSNMLKFLKLEDSVADQLAERDITPVVALAASRFPAEVQSQIVAGLKTARKKKGGSLTPNEVSMEASRIGEELKVSPNKPKKGKVQFDYKKYLVSFVIRAIIALIKKIEELLAVPDNELEKVPGDFLIELHQEVGHLEVVVKKLAEKMIIVA